MLGWINDCVEQLVLDKFGVDAWHLVKEKAGCDTPDGGFLKLEHYSDKVRSSDEAFIHTQVHALCDVV